MDYASYKELVIQREGRVLTITMNQPGRRNAINGTMHRELARIFNDVAMDDEADVIVLTGAGDTFCAGGDIGWMQGLVAERNGMAKIAIEGKRVITSLLDLEKPLICRLNGDAIGLGATLALFCDMVIAVDDARIADPHVRVGLVAGDGGAIIWPQLIGYARAKEFLMTGDVIGAEDAARMGLINRVVPAAQLDQEVNRMVEKLLRGPQNAARWTKVSVNIGLKQLAASVIDASLGYEVASSMMGDHREGLSAFVEKRFPQFDKSS